MKQSLNICLNEELLGQGPLLVKDLNVESVISDASSQINRATLILKDHYFDTFTACRTYKSNANLRTHTRTQNPSLSSLAWNAASIAWAKHAAISEQMENEIKKHKQHTRWWWPIR
jgi:hypothetical protein